MAAHDSDKTQRPVLILGAGVNGLCVARELAVNGVPVVVVDKADLGGGTTAKSSRLIHGGLRYLEYGEFRLVRESLVERTRLLKLAPQFVRPLRLHIPIRRRMGGLLHAGLKFLGLGRIAWLQRLLNALGITAERGRWAVQIGLTWYDWIARKGGLPGHTVVASSNPGSPAVDRNRYRWVCSYWDAQMFAPERFCVALAQDAARAAKENNVPFELLTYHEARLSGDTVEITSTLPGSSELPRRLQPAMIVNATGAWGDLTLESLPVGAPRLFGGTRGSHILTRQPQLRNAIGKDGVYAEAADGRLVFILPWGESVLIGTTDERFEGPPDEAVATEEEVAYLVKMVNQVFDQVQLRVTDVLAHYSGIRPLPYVPAGKTAAISRDHSIDTRHTSEGLRIDTIVGGKLTTCRALGEQVADRVIGHLGRSRTADTRDRPIPGGANYPDTNAARETALNSLITRCGLSPARADAVWDLFGTAAADVLADAGLPSPDPHLSTADILPGTELPLAVVDWIIRREYVRTVSDLVERRLLLVFDPGLKYETLLMLEERIRAVHGDCRQGAKAAVEHLQRHFGITLSGTPE